VPVSHSADASSVTGGKMVAKGNGGVQADGGNMGMYRKMVGRTGFWVECCRLQG